MVRRMIRKLVRNDRRGVLALEAALIFPIAVLLLVGLVESYLYMRSVLIAERVVSTLSMMIAKRQYIGDCNQTNRPDYLGNLFLAAEYMAEPMSLPANGMLIVSGISNPGSGTPANAGTIINWQRRTSYKLEGAKSDLGVQNAKPVLPDGIIVKPTAGLQADTLIVVEFIYKFRPFPGTHTFISDLPTDITFRRTSYARGRWETLATPTAVAGCAPLPTP